MFIMYERLLRLYLNGQAKEHHLKNAIKKEILTQEEYDDIIKAKEEQDKKDSEVLTATSQDTPIVGK